MKSPLSRTIEYWTRQSGRALTLVLTLGLLFVAIMALIWLVPRVWHWAIG